MPLSQFSDGLRNTLMLLPGTYGTGIIRNHMMRGVLRELQSQGLPSQFITSLSKSFDATLVFFGHDVSVWAMYLVLGLTVAVLIGLFILLGYIRKRAKTKKALAKANPIAK